MTEPQEVRPETRNVTVQLTADEYEKLSVLAKADRRTRASMGAVILAANLDTWAAPKGGKLQYPPGVRRRAAVPQTTIDHLLEAPTLDTVPSVVDVRDGA